MLLSCVSDLWCEVGLVTALPLGGKPLSIPLLELFPVCLLSCVTFKPFCKLSDYADVRSFLSPTLTMGMPAIGPGVSLTLPSPGHQSTSTEVRCQHCSNHASGPAVCYGDISDSSLTDPSHLCAHKVYSYKLSWLQEHSSVQLFFRD